MPAYVWMFWISQKCDLYFVVEMNKLAEETGVPNRM